MSAETLRQAASLMRERAEGAALVTAAGDVAPWHTPADLLGMFGEDGDADHIASWHPDVALAVADWLDSCADHEELLPGSQGYAMTVARAYLGESA